MFFHFAKLTKGRSLSTRRNLWLLRTETTLTFSNPVVPLLPLLFYSLGLSQTHIGFHEAIFSSCWLLFNIPTGWLADRFSRKACNIVGDALAGSSFFVLANATSFTGIVVSGLLLSLGFTTSQGADVALMRECCKQLDISYVRELARQRSICPLISIGFVATGSLLAAYDLRLGLMWGGVPFLLAAVVACFVTETGSRRSLDVSEGTLLAQIRGAIIDMKTITLYCLRDNRRLGWLMLTKTAVIMLTGPIMWMITPLLLQAGVPMTIVASGWILHIGTISLGAWLYQYAIDRWSERTRIFVPAGIAIGVMFILPFVTNIWTVWLIGIIGLCRGWHSVVFTPLIQDEAPKDVQATVSSVSLSLFQPCYILGVVLINWAGSFDVKWGFIANCALFLPFVVIAWRRTPQIAR